MLALGAGVHTTLAQASIAAGLRGIEVGPAPRLDHPYLRLMTASQLFETIKIKIL
jgi:hypothetical protein